MRKTCEQIVECNGVVERSFEWKKKPFGRRYTVNYGLQGLKKAIRGVLSEGLTTDVDIKASHQMILLKICRDRGIKCDNLKEYIQFREEKLKDMFETDNMNREDAKDTFHKCINSHKRITNVSNQFFKSFDDEMKRISEYLFNEIDLEWMKKYAERQRQ